MKILHVIYSVSSRYGGPQKACLEMASAVARLGHEVSVYTTNIDGKSNLDVPIGVPIVRDGITIKYYRVNAPRAVRYSVGLGKALRSDINKFDIVHIHSMYQYPSIIASIVCRAKSVPYIVRPHGTLTPYIYNRHRFRKALFEYAFEINNYNKAAAVHFTSEEEKRTCSFKLKYPGIVVPLGLNIDGFEHSERHGSFRNKHGISTNARVILFLSRLSHQKGINILIESFMKIAIQDKYAFLLVVGPDDENIWKKYDAVLLKSGLKGRYLYVGLLEGADKNSAINDSDLFVLPSMMENFGLSIFESMAMGLPVLISEKVHLWREIVQAGAGLMAPCSVSAFHENMMSMLADIPALKEMGQKARKLVKDKYDWKVIAPRLIKMYSEVIENHNKTNRIPNAKVI